MKDGWVTESMFFSTALQSGFDAFRLMGLASRCQSLQIHRVMRREVAGSIDKDSQGQMRHAKQYERIRLRMKRIATIEPPSNYSEPFFDFKRRCASFHA
jgi:hypothetical protein